ncbi:hypothetical protein ACFL21_02815 [Patescibacteria group bacterium]
MRTSTEQLGEKEQLNTAFSIEKLDPVGEKLNGSFVRFSQLFPEAVLPYLQQRFVSVEQVDGDEEEVDQVQAEIKGLAQEFLQNLDEIFTKKIAASEEYFDQEVVDASDDSLLDEAISLVTREKIAKLIDKGALPDLDGLLK